MLRRALLRRAVFRRLLPSTPQQSKGRVLLALTSFSNSNTASQTSTPCQHRHNITGISKRWLHSSSSRKALQPFKLADIGEGITEVEILKWHVKEGQEVQEFDVLCEVQSDKSSVELTAHASGVVRNLKFEEGQTAKVGQVLCSIQDGPEEEAPSPSLAEESASQPTDEDISPAVQHAEQQTEQIEKSKESSSSTAAKDGEAEGDESIDHSLFSSRDSAMDSVGSSRFSGEAGVLPSPSSSQALSPSTSRTHHPLAPPEVIASRQQASSQSSGTTAQEGPKRIVRASPAVRNLATRLGVDISSVRATGEGGRVSREDVEAADGGGRLSSQPMASSRQVEDRPRVRSTPRDAAPQSTKVEFGRTRKVMWRAMGDMGSVPHFGYSHTLDITPLLPYLKTLNAPQIPSTPSYTASDIPLDLVRSALDDAPRQKTTLLSFLVKALLLALEEHPIMRARAKEENGLRYLNIGRDGVVGIAVSDPKFGLLTPSLPPMSPSATLTQITNALSTLRQNASKPSPTPNLTISSVGALGEARGAMPVLPPGGGVAICAVGRARWEAEWEVGKRKPMDCTPEEVSSGGMEAVLRVPVGWSGDHRILEGAELIAFTETWKSYIENPGKWILS